MTPSKRRRFRSTGHRYYRKEGCSSSTPLASRCNSLPSSTTRCMLGTSSHAQAQCACPFHGLLPQGPPLQKIHVPPPRLLAGPPCPFPSTRAWPRPWIGQGRLLICLRFIHHHRGNCFLLEVERKDAVSSTYLEADTPPTCQRTRINKS